MSVRDALELASGCPATAGWNKFGINKRERERKRDRGYQLDDSYLERKTLIFRIYIQIRDVLFTMLNFRKENRNCYSLLKQHNNFLEF